MCLRGAYCVDLFVFIAWIRECGFNVVKLFLIVFVVAFDVIQSVAAAKACGIHQRVGS